jgi:hypothetical protein
MDEYTNSAKRLLAIIERILAIPDGTTVAQAWIKALGLDSEKFKENPHELYQQIGRISSEIESVGRGMAGCLLSKPLYAPYLDRLQRTVSISNFDTSWGSFKPFLQSDTLLSLRVCAELLPREPIIPLAELESLLNSIIEIRNEINEASLSLKTKEFLLRQLSILEAGIRDYPLSGNRSITEAFHKGFNEVANASAPEKPGEEAAYARVMQIWKGLWRSSKEVLHMDNLLTFMGKKIEEGAPLLEWLVTPLA